MSNPSSSHPIFDRLSHGLNLVNFIVLIVTGMMIHSPFEGMPMNLIRNLHFIFAYILIINGVVRLYWSFMSKNGDYKDLLFTKADLKNLWPQIKYYLFLGKHPETRKYNPPQILAYFLLLVMGVCMIITGLILLFPQTFLAYSIFSLYAVRLIHYFFTWAFIIIILIHIYLAVTEAPGEFLLMFFGKEEHKKEV